MQRIERAFTLLQELDEVYKKVVTDSCDSVSGIDELIGELLEFENIDSFNEDERELIVTIIKSFTIKSELINKILEFRKDTKERLDRIKDEFKLLEAKRFEIVNNYVVGTVKKEDIDLFKKLLFDFRKKLYAIPISDSNIMEIAKMKSKIQHFETEVLEDEDVLRVAYSNSN